MRYAVINKSKTNIPVVALKIRCRNVLKYRKYS